MIGEDKNVYSESIELLTIYKIQFIGKNLNDLIYDSLNFSSFN